MAEYDCFLGDIRLFPYTFAPSDWMDCCGQVLEIQLNTALFSLIGNRYGGDGHRTFALPNLRGTEPIPNLHYCICLNGVFPTRE